MNVTELKWYDALDALTGQTLTDKQIEIWQAYLRSANASNNDLRGAIEMASGDAMKGEGVYGRVTVKDLTTWLRIYRKRQRTQANSEQSKAMLEGFIAEWKEKLSRGASRDDFLSSVETLPFGIVERNNICKRVLGK